MKVGSRIGDITIEVFLLGLMAISMKENSKKGKNMAKGYTFNLRGGSMWVNTRMD